MNENLGMSGRIEVVLEDKHGNVKHKETHRNTITDTFKRYALYDTFNHSTLSNVLQTSGGTSGKNYVALDRTAPANFGIYTMKEDIDIQPNTLIPPYVDNTRENINDKVVFYNAKGSAAEDSVTMIPHQPKCFYSLDTKEIVVEYRKQTGTGTIKSVCIGRNHSTKEDQYIVPLKDYGAQPEWFTGWTANYLLEHSKDSGTTIYKANGSAAANKSYSFNCKTKDYKDYGSITNMNSNISTYFGGLVIGSTIFKHSSKSINATNKTITCKVTAIKNWREATTATIFDIIFPTDNEMPVYNVTCHPIFVHNTDTGNLEIFVTTSVGDHDGDVGCNIMKAVVNPDDFTYTIENLGIHPYCVYGWTAVTVGVYSTGFYKNGMYYLPIYGTFQGGDVIVTATATYQEGIRIDKDFEEEPEIICYRANSNGTVINYVDTDAGPLQCFTGNAASPYVFVTQVISGANLDEPITKELDDILRVRYYYQIV